MPSRQTTLARLVLWYLSRLCPVIGQKKKPWEQAFMGITGCHGGGTPAFMPRDLEEAQANIFGCERFSVQGYPWACI